MIKRTALILSISATYFLQAQDISTLRNTVDVYSNNAITGTSKYQGMAGAMGALGGDFSALNSNPAGIGVSVASDFSATLNIENNKNATSYASKTNNYSINKTDLGNIGGVITFRTPDASRWKFVNLGVSYSTQSIEDYSETPANSGVIYDIKDTGGTVIDNLTFDGHAYNRYGRISKMSVGVGANYENSLYIGAGLNFHSANVEQYDTAAFNSSKYGTTEYFDKQYTPFSESSTGFSANVGVIGKLNPYFRVGAALETPTWWQMNRNFDFYNDPINGDGTGLEERRLTSPMKAILSAAFVANKNFSIDIDYTLGITKPNYKVFGNAEKELNDFFSKNAKNLSEIKVGAEYRIAGFRLRGGYGYAANPFDAITANSFVNGSNQNVSYQNLILGKRNTLAAGLGYDFRSFYIDAAYQNVQSEYSSPFMQGSSTFNSGYFSDLYIVNSSAYLVSNVKNTRNNFFITLGWKF